MHEFSHHRSALLNDAFDSYAESGVLNERQRKLVAGLIRNAAVQNLVFSEPNVKRCIGLNYWLHEALSNTRPERRGFLEAMLRALHRLWSLSPSQIMAINKWGERLRERVHSFPHIDPRVFEGVRIPAFMQSKNSSGK